MAIKALSGGFLRGEKVLRIERRVIFIPFGIFWYLHQNLKGKEESSFVGGGGLGGGGGGGGGGGCHPTAHHYLAHC
jgi:hypothetical protein